MRKLVKLTSIVILLTLIIYNLLFFLNTSYVQAVSQSVSNNIDQIDEKLYPGIKERIKSLKSKYPNWNFEILYTDLDWNEVMLAEYSGHGSSPKSLIYYTYKGAWICSICENAAYDNGSWRCASLEAVRYKMDPRNLLNEDDIFQFEVLSNKGQTIEQLKTITNNTYLSGKEQSIINVANSCNVNSFYLAARLIQEQGANATSPLALGTGYNGQYVGYYNVFNFGASGSNAEEVILNGLAYAQRQGWNTLEKSIAGGIKNLSQNYIAKGQNTLYLQKFDVEATNGLYEHQYMQNLTAPTTEAITLKKAYKNTNSVESSHTFLIPVYKNMPKEVSPEPDSNGKSQPVNYTKARVNVDGTLNLRNTPAGSVIDGQALSNSDVVTIVEKATTKISGTYWDKVRKSNGVEGYAARQRYDGEPYKLYLIPILENSNTSNTPTKSSIATLSNLGIEGAYDFKGFNPNTETYSLMVPNSVSKVKVYAVKGHTAQTVTGLGEHTLKEGLNTISVVVTAEDGVTKKTYKINITRKKQQSDKYKLGDCNNDGYIDSGDLLTLKKHLLGTKVVTDANLLLAMDVNIDGYIDSGDLLLIKKHLLGTYIIE